MRYEVRFHGRGGQGAVTAANILVVAASKEGKWGQAIPSFGAERRGAPVVAFARIADKPIKRRSQVYSPDAVVVLDPMIYKVVNVTMGLKEGGVLVINSPVKPVEVASSGKYRVFYVDANKIAEDLGLIVAGWPVVNTAILGALIKATNIVSLNTVLDAIKSLWKGRLGELNSTATKLAYEKTEALV